MNKLNNSTINKVSFGLGILVIIILGIMLLPNVSHARTYGRTCGEAGCNYNYKSAEGEKTKYQNPLVTSTVYSESGTSSTATSSAPKATTTVAKKTATAKTTASTTKPVKTAEDVSDLAANVVYGSNSFMPSGLIQWILFAILILLMVILVRRVFRGEKDYHSTPLKHA